MPAVVSRPVRDAISPPGPMAVFAAHPKDVAERMHSIARIVIEPVRSPRPIQLGAGAVFRVWAGGGDRPGPAFTLVIVGTAVRPGGVGSHFVDRGGRSVTRPRDKLLVDAHEGIAREGAQIRRRRGEHAEADRQRIVRIDRVGVAVDAVGFERGLHRFKIGFDVGYFRAGLGVQKIGYRDGRQNADDGHHDQ